MAKPGKTKLPKWDEENLVQHYERHPSGRDKECWADILQATHVTEARYENASLDVIENAWLEYEAEVRDIDGQCYRENRAYYVDDRLIVVATDFGRQTIVTCYHDHWHSLGRHVSGENQTIPVGERRERYRRALENAERDGRIRSLRIIRDGTK